MILQIFRVLSHVRIFLLSPYLQESAQWFSYSLAQTEGVVFRNLSHVASGVEVTFRAITEAFCSLGTLNWESKFIFHYIFSLRFLACLTLNKSIALYSYLHENLPFMGCLQYVLVARGPKVILWAGILLLHCIDHRCPLCHCNTVTDAL